MTVDPSHKHLKTKKRKNKNVVSFDEEIITKDGAEKFLCEEVSEPYRTNINSLEAVEEIKLKNKKHKPKKVVEKTGEKPDELSKTVDTSNLKSKKQKRNKLPENSEIIVPDETLSTDVEPDTNSKLKIKKHKRKKSAETNEIIQYTEKANINVDTKSSLKRKKSSEKDSIQDMENEENGNEITSDINLEKPGTREESIRAKKRKKHAKLMEEKRLKIELTAQQNALNYLSLWKHNRNEWKFEKLKQIWLQQNLFESSKIPEEFWETVVEYFCGSKGSIRKVILKKALDIIEKEDKSEEENTDEDYLLILKRARDIVQNLQE